MTLEFDVSEGVSAPRREASEGGEGDGGGWRVGELYLHHVGRPGTHDRQAHRVCYVPC
jgi:hypothetical protein